MVYTDDGEELSQEAVIKRLKKLDKLIGQDLKAAFDSQIPKAGTNTEQGDVAAPNKRTIKENAKWYAGNKCEICAEHKSFIAQDGRMYTEAHHLIPLAGQAEFENSLNQEQNIVCLCPNCHREIHHGMNKLELAEMLWNKRKTELKAAGIGINLSDLKHIINET
ncbi:MAG: HNH endonuclease [Treponemataceae bacterium]|nr:HNH endonuclease [Treponemataceae bacterium]